MKSPSKSHWRRLVWSHDYEGLAERAESLGNQGLPAMVKQVVVRSIGPNLVVWYVLCIADRWMGKRLTTTTGRYALPKVTDIDGQDHPA